MKHKIIGLIVCVLMILNTSTIIGTSTDTTKTTQETVMNIIPKMTHNNHDNWAPNPSFEEGDSMPTGWTYSINNTSKYHWDSTISHSGEKSIGALNFSNDTRWSCWITTDFIPVDLVEETYEFSGWYKFIGTSTKQPSALFELDMYDENYTHLGGSGQGFNYSLEWKYQSWNTSGMGGTIVNETRYVKLKLYQVYFTHTEPDPLIEIRFDDIYFGYGNDAPSPPSISGPSNGKIKVSLVYNFTTTDPDGDDTYFFIDWGDNTTNGWIGPYNSGGTITATHTWSESGTYKIQVKTKDTYGAESNWSEPFTIYITSKMLLIGYVQSAMNQGDECIILNLSIALIIKLKPINLKMYSSVQVLILNNELHGVLGSKFLAVLVYALVLSKAPFTIHSFR